MTAGPPTNGRHDARRPGTHRARVGRPRLARQAPGAPVESAAHCLHSCPPDLVVEVCADLALDGPRCRHPCASCGCAATCRQPTCRRGRTVVSSTAARPSRPRPPVRVSPVWARSCADTRATIWRARADAPRYRRRRGRSPTTRLGRWKVGERALIDVGHPPALLNRVEGRNHPRGPEKARGHESEYASGHRQEPSRQPGLSRPTGPSGRASCSSVPAVQSSCGASRRAPCDPAGSEYACLLPWGVWVRTDLGPSRDPSAARPPRPTAARSRPGPAG